MQKIKNVKIREFIELYPSIDTAYHTKSWKVIVELEKCGELTLLNYCDGVLKDVDIARFSGRGVDTIKRWKKEKTLDVFAYEAFREKSVRCLAVELSS